MGLLINRVFVTIMKLNISEYDKARIISSLETSLLVDKKDILLDNLWIDNNKDNPLYSDYNYIKNPSNVKMIILSLKNTSQMLDIRSQYGSGGGLYQYRPFSSGFSPSDRLEMTLLSCTNVYENDEDRMYFLRRAYKKPNDEIKTTVALSLDSDDKKIELLESIESKFYRAKVVASLSSNDIKSEELENQKKEYNKALIIASLEIPDDEKLELMQRKKIYNKENKTLIVKELLSDSKKLKLIEENFGEYNIAQIIGSLSLSDEEKIILFEHYNDGIFDSSCVDLLVTLESNDKKFNLINKIKEYEKEQEKETGSPRPP